ncbi:MAG: ABC transporter substrate-binding protein [Pseudomonadota bacterium]|nr:ABC transporter substrate-binding protein [Pseudomonadota bacterium]
MKLQLCRAVAALALSVVATAHSVQADELTKLTVGVSPSTIVVPVYLAQQQGIFAKHGLDVEMGVLQSGAEAIPRLLNGSWDIAVGDAVGTINAVKNRVPLKVIGINSIGAPSSDLDYSALVTRSDSIKGFDTAMGHTIAVNQAGGIAELTARAAIDRSGGDSSKVQFVELPFPQMIEAVAQSRVDGAILVEPFVSMAPGAGLEIAGRPQSTGIPGVPPVFFVASAAGTEAKGDAFRAFLVAIKEANEVAQADGQLSREVAASYSPMTVEQLQNTRLPVFPEDPADMTEVQSLLDLMLKYSLIDQAPDMADLVWADATQAK